MYSHVNRKEAFTMKTSRKFLLLLLLAFLSCTLIFTFSACTEVPEGKKAEAAEESPESSRTFTKIVHMEIPIKWLTLGDLVRNYPTIAYGTILEKSEFVEPPSMILTLMPREAEKHKRYQKTTMRVEKGIQYCDGRETITYWELGGISEDGILYEPNGFDKSQPGETVLIFLNQVGTAFHLQFQADNEGNVTIPGNLLIEETSNGDSSQFTIPEDRVMPMEEYLDKVEKVVREQEAAG